jgi:Icc protein
MSSRVLHITDLHWHADPQFELMGVNTRASLQAVLDHANCSEAAYDLILITGDLTQDPSATAYTDLCQLLDTLETPVHVLPGNHDSPELMQQYLNSQWVSTQAHFQISNWQVLLLDSSQANNDGGYLSDAQLTFMKHTLASNPQPCLLAVHHQPVPIGSAWLDTMQITNSGDLFQLMQNNKQVKALVWGHVHQAFADEFNEVMLIATPATCRQFLPGSDEFAIDPNKSAGYRELILHDNGELETSIHWL